MVKRLEWQQAHKARVARRKAKRLTQWALKDLLARGLVEKTARGYDWTQLGFEMLKALPLETVERSAQMMEAFNAT